MKKELFIPKIEAFFFFFFFHPAPLPHLEK